MHRDIYWAHNDGDNAAKLMAIRPDGTRIVFVLADGATRDLWTVGADGTGAAVLVDCVEGGASVSFLAPLPHAEARAFWRDTADAVAWHAARTQPLNPCPGPSAGGC